MPTVILTFTTAFIASIGLTPAVRELALHLGVIDRPGPRKLHMKPVPLLGGVAIYAATIATILLFLDPNARPHALEILVAGSLLAIVGTLDDRGVLHPQIKLMIAMPVAAAILIFSGIYAPVFEAPKVSDLVFQPLPSPTLASSLPTVPRVANCLLTVLWVVGITAGFSILDHMDGLCAGIAGVASAFFLLFAVLSGQALEGTMAAAVLGASLGFLRWNFNPAKIFMGDTGAVFLGFMMATLGLKLRFLENPHAANWMIPVLILGVPIFDTSLVTFSRIRRGIVPFASPGKDHTAHRLSNLGLGQRGAVGVLYTTGIILGLLALVVTRLSVESSYALVGIVSLLGLTGIFFLERAPYERQELTSPR